MKPFIRWAGSKRRLLPILQSYWNKKYNRYIEPFMGSAALFLDLQPSKAILGDINDELINAFLTVRDQPVALYGELVKMEQGKESYYRFRAMNPLAMNKLDRAARFIFLNRFCFNGLYRTNLAGKFNVPYSPSRTGKLPTLNVLQESSDLLKNTIITCKDFESLLNEEAREGDFVYLDPPYATNNSRVFCQYGSSVFGISDINRLNRLLITLDKKGVHFLLSYGECPEAKDIFSGWGSKCVSVQRNISGFVKGRRLSTEMLISNIN